MAPPIRFSAAVSLKSVFLPGEELSSERHEVSAWSDRSTRNSPVKENAVVAESLSKSASEYTTVRLKRIPASMDRESLIKVVHDEGFAGLCDFVFLPFDPETMKVHGIAIMNFTSTEAANRFMQNVSQFPALNKAGSKQRVRAEWADVQGLAAQINRYRYSGMMFNSKFNSFRPVALGPKGNRISFNEVVSWLRTKGNWTPMDESGSKDKGGQGAQRWGRRARKLDYQPKESDESADLMEQARKMHEISRLQDAKVDSAEQDAVFKMEHSSLLWLAHPSQDGDLASKSETGCGVPTAHFTHSFDLFSTPNGKRHTKIPRPQYQ